jgi:nitrogen fixation protein NifU and related proteins
MSQIQLYQQLILHHNKSPKNFRKLDPCSHHAEGYNPLCGDHFSVYLNIDNNSIIKEITFHGSGCAISKSSASIMTEIIKGTTTTQAKKIFAVAQGMFTGKSSKDESLTLKKLEIFSNISRYPTRIKCASLAWHAMLNAAEQTGTATTE